ncbi:hypothetical protein [uncultured Tenacibaculum sp.]|uniref:hypothetical protein n=1 Tax=uncultured Tenacibaculum sp. TaxID=174713 RepID=UPI002638AB1B|nr:hypothetical protein [uncultured Tenacibaculum sp.]
MKKIITLNELTAECGYFTSDTNLNNGYGCKENESKTCHAYNCPVAHQLDYNDLKNCSNMDEFDHIESQDDMPWGWGDDLMGIDLKQIKNK